MLSLVETTGGNIPLCESTQGTSSDQPPPKMYLPSKEYRNCELNSSWFVLLKNGTAKSVLNGGDVQ